MYVSVVNDDLPIENQVPIIGVQTNIVSSLSRMG